MLVKFSHFFSCVQLYLLDAVLGMKTHSNFEGGSVGMVLQSAPLYGQSFKKKKHRILVILMKTQ